MSVSWSNNRNLWLFVLSLLVGTALRFWVMSFGHNYDFDSYLIVREVVREGGNIYAATDRYNYGPVWFNVLGVLDLFSGLANPPHSPLVFRMLVVAFLTIIDAGISLLLWKRFGTAAACTYFVNPISVIISGYHNQFDNFAIFLALAGILLYEKSSANSHTLSRSYLAGLLLIGASLMTKHLLFLFPLWLAARETRQSRKIISLVLPIVIFIFAFAPWWAGGSDSIIQHVFLYRSLPDPMIYHFFVPRVLQSLLSPTLFWVSVLTIGAFYFRNYSPTKALAIYLCLLFMFSPSIANQYYVIPLLYVVGYRRIWSLAYVVLASMILLVSDTGLGVRTFFSEYVYFLRLFAVLLLFASFATSVWQPAISRVISAVSNEVKVQFAGFMNGTR